MAKSLTVYKASAGSGKTFTLATQYIKLLVLNPQNYRSILAVTFTNKAKEEMKMRILSQLYGIWQQLPDSQNYLRHIIAETGLQEEMVVQRAGEALRLLLHNYSFFHVETIDAFFQQVLRNLARELELSANYRVGLNDVQVEEQAVDQLIDSLTHSDILLQWLLSYIMDTINDDRSWNIIGQVKQFGRTIFRDYYKEQGQTLVEKMEEKGFVEQYIQQLKTIRQDAESHMKGLAQEFFDILQAEQLTIEDFPYGKSGVAGLFLKLQKGQMDDSIFGKRVTDCVGDATKWYSKSSKQREHIHMVAESALIPLLNRVMNDQPRQYRLYQSAVLTLKHLSHLRLLGRIEQKVRELNEESGRFLLSDTQHFLHSLMQGSDSPFIFEKIGTQLEHVMIDEFQDTSTIQWRNFKVLLQECMSHQESENLIVGDVKQSIYRWRSGDWRLLNGIEQEFPHADSSVEVKSLVNNYRSDRCIIDFNNAFFTLAAQQEYQRLMEDNPQGAEQLSHAYQDVCQQVPANKPAAGQVKIQLLPADDYQQHTLEMLTDAIGKLISKGTSPSEIAILVRSNRHIPLIANHLAVEMPHLRIISDEAFRLDASTSVCLLVSALRSLCHPNDNLIKATVVKLYQRAVMQNPAEESELLVSDISLDSLLPEEYVEQRTALLQLPLYELVERLYGIFSLHRISQQDSYLCAFFDQLHKFTQENASDIESFLREWDSVVCSKTVHSEVTEGIRIMSIHKSKGLEFRHVIIPFCDWQMEHADLLWCQPQEAPFNQLPLVPVDYSGKQMRGTIYEGDYLDEHLQNTVDNLNLLYVAFTRAASSLLVIGQRNSKSSRSALIEQVLQDIRLEGAILQGMEDEKSPICYEYGAAVQKEPATPTSQPTRNVFLQPVTPEHVSFQSFETKATFRQSNQSRQFVAGEDEADAHDYITMGTVLHELFSTIRTTADIPKALQQMQQNGVLYDDNIQADHLQKLLKKRLESLLVSEWFSDKWTVFNECKIIFTDEQNNMVERRPDRVITNGEETHVIDFKFGHPRPEYQQQVQEYIQLLQSMGMPSVKGWLWYVYNNQIEEVMSDGGANSK